MERLDHPIGEPVGEGVKRTRIGRSYPNSPLGKKLPRFYLRRLFAMVVAMGIALVIVSVFLFPIIIFMPFMCLIMPLVLFGCLIIAFPIAMIIVQSRLKDLKRNETVLTKEGIHVRSAYAIGNPTTVVDIPFDNIVHVSKLSIERWNEMYRGAPILFRLTNGSPYPDPGALFTIFSDPEDLVSIELARTMEIERLLPSKGIRAPVMRTHTVKEIIVDIDGPLIEEFIVEVSKRTGGGPHG